MCNETLKVRSWLASGWSHNYFFRRKQRERTVSNFRELVAVATSHCHISWSVIHSYFSLFLSLMVATSYSFPVTLFYVESGISASCWMKLPFDLGQMRIINNSWHRLRFDDILATREPIYCNAAGNQKNRLASERSTPVRINRGYSTLFDVLESDVF